MIETRKTIEGASIGHLSLAPPDQRYTARIGVATRAREMASGKDIAVGIDLGELQRARGVRTRLRCMARAEETPRRMLH
jgi:hypothetical protein